MQKIAVRNDPKSLLAAPPKNPKQAAAGPTEAAIAERAYQKFCDRGCQHGFAEQDWIAAERELTAAGKGAC